MKEWKQEIVDKLTEVAKAKTTVMFYEDAAAPMGYTHICRQDVMDIARGFMKANPEYKPYRFVNENENYSYFRVLGFSTCTFDSGEDVY